MIWNDHSKLSGRHAILNPSGSSTWLNYPNDDPEKLFNRYVSQYSAEIGTLVHEFCQDHLHFGIKMHAKAKQELLLYLLKHKIPRSVIDIDYIFPTVMNYINDAIGFRMDSEILLYYSDTCFGTADAISFRKNNLKIHDLKTGKTPAHMEQLETYAALFCMEYHFNPEDIEIELAIYQGGDILEEKPEPELIKSIIEDIRVKDSMIAEWQKGDDL